MSDSAQVRSTAWAAYYQAHETRPVSPLLQRAINPVIDNPAPLQAVDLGCGAGRETRFLLDAGWNVFAMDREPLAIEQVQRLVPTEHCSRLTVKVACFEELEALPGSALIHAGLSLPFCQPQRFAALWELILSALEPGGVFVGQLFGDRDGWSGNPDMTFHTAGEVTALLAALDIQFLHEFEEDGNSMQGPKHWHRFDIIATKPVRD